jgi:hypothetical protein
MEVNSTNSNYRSLISDNIIWDTSWGSTPDFWHESNYQNNNIISSWDKNTSSFTWRKDNGSQIVTIFAVAEPTLAANSAFDTMYSYDPIPGDVGPGGGGAYDVAQVRIQYVDAGLNLSTIRNVWSYLGTYPSETLKGNIATFSTGSGMRCYVVQARTDSTVSNTISYRTLNGTSSTLSVNNAGLFVITDIQEFQSVVYLGSNQAQFNGIKEYLVYYSTLSTTDRNQIETHLKNKWGLSY